MTMDQAETRPMEEKVAAVENWIKHIDVNQEVLPLDPDFVKEILTHFGANFENLSDEAVSALDPKGYSTKAKKSGIVAIWGEKYNSYRDWARKYSDEYEARTGKTLPTINIIKDGVKVGNTKISGMTQLFSELTELAVGTLPFEDFKLHTEVRIKNGLARAEGRSDDIIRINVPNTDKPRAISSVPPGFAKDMIVYLKTSVLA